MDMYQYAAQLLAETLVVFGDLMSDRSSPKIVKAGRMLVKVGGVSTVLISVSRLVIKISVGIDI